MGVAQLVCFNRALQCGEDHAFAIGWAIALDGQFECTRFDFFSKHGGLGDVIDQTPVFRFLTTHTFGGGAENISQVVTHMALVGHAGQATGAR